MSEQLLLELLLENDKANKGLDQTSGKVENLGSKAEASGTKTKGFGGKIAGLGAALGTAATALTATAGAVTGLGVALAPVGIAAFNVANDFNEAQRNIQNSLGLSASEAQNFANIANDVFKAGVGGSLDEVSDALISVKQNLGDFASEAEFGPLIAQASALSNVMDEDVNKIFNSASAVADQFGISGAAAMDLITVATQSGLNTSGDLLDTLGEYSGTFATFGASAQQAFAIMQTGQAQGVHGTDRVSDAILTMMESLNAGGDDMARMFEGMGLDLRTMQASVSTGNAVWADYFDSIIGGINGISDPIAQGAAQVALFGEQGLVLGQAFTEGLTTVTGQFANVEGAAANLAANALTPFQQMQGEFRTILGLLQPIGQMMIDAFSTKALPVLQSVTAQLSTLADTVGPRFTQFTNDMSAVWAVAGPMIGESLGRISEAFGRIHALMFPMSAALGENTDAFSILDTTLNAIVKSVAFVAVGFEKAADAIGIAADLADQFATIQDKINPANIAANLIGGNDAFAGSDGNNGILDAIGGAVNNLPFVGGGNNQPATQPAAQGGNMQITPGVTQMFLDSTPIGQAVTNFQGKQASNFGAVGFADL